MKLYTDEEIRSMAGHPYCINEINGFLRGFRKAQALDIIDICGNPRINDPYSTINSNIQYPQINTSGNFMYPHLEEDKIFNTNFEVIEKYVKGIPKSEETKKKLSESLKGNKNALKQCDNN